MTFISSGLPLSFPPSEEVTEDEDTQLYEDAITSECIILMTSSDPVEIERAEVRRDLLEVLLSLRS